MKKTASIFIAVLLCFAVISAVGCNGQPSQDHFPPEETTQPPTQTFTPHSSAVGIQNRVAATDEMLVVFSESESADFYYADGYTNGGVFDCTWRSSSAVVSGGVMSMSVKSEGSGYAGAEYRSRNTFSYGFYSVCMKAADCSGVVSSFFTYTSEPVWDEIDIEFLGKDMTIVQFNYYTNGVGSHELIFDLGFDASKDFHEYAFDWREDSITWYVDGIAVYRAVENIPSHPMKIMMNVWNAKGSDGWTGALDVSALPATAQYKWIAYSAH